VRHVGVSRCNITVAAAAALSATGILWG